MRPEARALLALLIVLLVALSSTRVIDDYVDDYTDEALKNVITSYSIHYTKLYDTGDRLWSSLPGLRPLATITHDTLDWYGWDDDGGGIHDVIGTRCDPYTNFMLKGVDYHYCCHSNP